MSYIAYAWIAAFFFASVAIIGKLTTKYAFSNPWLFNFLWNFFSLIITAVLAYSNQVQLPSAWSNIVLGSIFYSLFGILYIIGLSKLDISVFIPLFNFRTAIGVILGVTFLGEHVNVTQIILVAFIFIAGMFVSLDEKFSLRSFFQKNIALAILSTVFYSFSNIFVNKSVAQNGYWEASLWIAALTQCIILFTIPLFIKNLRQVNFKSTGATLMMSLALAFGTLAANKAYAVNVSISSVITALPISMIMVFVLSIFAPKLLEKHTMKVYAIRFAAAAIMFIAAIKLTV